MEVKKLGVVHSIECAVAEILMICSMSEENLNGGDVDPGMDCIGEHGEKKRLRLSLHGLQGGGVLVGG